MAASDDIKPRVALERITLDSSNAAFLKPMEKGIGGKAHLFFNRTLEMQHSGEGDAAVMVGVTQLLKCKIQGIPEGGDENDAAFELEAVMKGYFEVFPDSGIKEEADLDEFLVTMQAPVYAELRSHMTHLLNGMNLNMITVPWIMPENGTPEA